MIGLVFIILIIFSIIWFSVWLWFFKGGKFFGRKVRKAFKRAFELGNYKKAKDLLLRMSDLNTNPETKLKLGIVNLKLNEYDEAKTCFEQVLKILPKNFDALFYLAQVFQHQKNYDKAIETYTEAIKENSKNVDCYLNIGFIYSVQGNYIAAIKVLEEAREIFPDNVEVLFYIAKYKSELCDIENDEECQQILRDYTELTDKENLPNDFHISFAKVQARIGNIDEAIELCKNAIEANGGEMEAYKLLGLMQLVKKDFPGAKNSLSIALNFESNNAETHNLFSYLFCSHEDGCALQKCRKKYYELVNNQRLNKQ